MERSEKILHIKAGIKTLEEQACQCDVMIGFSCGVHFAVSNLIQLIEEVLEG